MAGRIPSDINETRFDAIIIGAGINGAGIARDAALRGLRVLLLDKGDIASGTTSWSTRLIHGGLRYLEYGEVGLVRESLRERERLFKIAPHLVKPLALLIPIYERSARGPLTIRAGMLAYDLLSFDKSLDHHHMLKRAAALKRAPGLETEGLRGAALYFDAQVEYAERLAVENALDARAYGATVLTYARVDRLIIEDGTTRGIEFTDLLSGGVHRARAPLTINVAGPWVDQLLTKLNQTSERMIGGTKGSHIIVNQFPGAPGDALYVEARADRRPFFVIPWNDKFLIGTTDINYEGDLDRVEADEREMAYLLDETNRIIPSARLTRASVLYTYSGVRPLPFTATHANGSITRRHFIRDHAPGLEGFLSIVGGKLTTYRNLAEQTVDIIFKKLNRRAPACATAVKALPGAAVEDFKSFCAQFKSQSSLPASTNARLLRVYGTRAVEVAEMAGANPALAEVFSPLTNAIGAEVVFSFEREMAETLVDCLLRRTMVGLDADAGLDALENGARLARTHLGWPESRVEHEINAYRNYIERFHPLKLSGQS